MSTLPPSLTLADSEVVRAFVQDYFDAWSGTDEDRILAHYADNVVIELPVGRLDGKAAVRDQFVRPFIAAFPGNIHVPLNLAHAPNLVAVEWRFEAVHRGTFTGIPRLEGPSVYPVARSTNMTSIAASSRAARSTSIWPRCSVSLGRMRERGRTTQMRFLRSEETKQSTPNES
jgi:hypothetical protein